MIIFLLKKLENDPLCKNKTALKNSKTHIPFLKYETLRGDQLNKVMLSWNRLILSQCCTSNFFIV